MSDAMAWASCGPSGALRNRSASTSLAVLRRWRGRLRVIQGMGNVPPIQGVMQVVRATGDD